MVYCAAFDCNNDSRKTTGISYHCFPKDPSLREQWLAKISHADLIISKSTRLCSEHFTPDCYERDLQAELLGSKKRASLKADAVPSIFSHRPAAKKPCLSSENRALEKARQEVNTRGAQLMMQSADTQTPLVCSSHTGTQFEESDIPEEKGTIAEEAVGTLSPEVSPQKEGTYLPSTSGEMSDDSNLESDHEDEKPKVLNPQDDTNTPFTPTLKHV
ncbi:THAP domain-containing protein 2-like [Montipora foliosa]|uniref:THAP domain-containing protein 2-like n=1 Tax=Montipora foliosa TaxID=591990 RepID=UPI0035F1A555